VTLTSCRQPNLIHNAKHRARPRPVHRLELGPAADGDARELILLRYFTDSLHHPNLLINRIFAYIDIVEVPGEFLPVFLNVLILIRLALLDKGLRRHVDEAYAPSLLEFLLVIIVDVDIVELGDN